MGDDIHQIEWQNRGLQVQTANQRSLINELQELLVSYYGSIDILQLYLLTPFLSNVTGVSPCI
jgi:hypothetical protein